MKKQNRVFISPDNFDILCATWILASNDQNEIMTYKGIIHRLGLKDDYDIKKLIQSRGDLFRKGVPTSRLDEWKKDMLEGQHRPSWIQEINDKSEKEREINKLTTNDVFRSQFRTEKNAERSPIDIIDWGLQHIERLRKAEMEKSVKWFVIVVGILNFVATIVAACVTAYVTLHMKR